LRLDKITLLEAASNFEDNPANQRQISPHHFRTSFSSDTMPSVVDRNAILHV